jgi:hypothetical protein
MQNLSAYPEYYRDRFLSLYGDRITEDSFPENERLPEVHAALLRSRAFWYTVPGTLDPGPRHNHFIDDWGLIPLENACPLFTQAWSNVYGGEIDDWHPFSMNFADSYYFRDVVFEVWPQMRVDEFMEAFGDVPDWMPVPDWPGAIIPQGAPFRQGDGPRRYRQLRAMWLMGICARQDKMTGANGGGKRGSVFK